MKKKKKRKKSWNLSITKRYVPELITIAYVILGFSLTEVNMTGLSLYGHAMLPRLELI